MNLIQRLNRAFRILWYFRLLIIVWCCIWFLISFLLHLFDNILCWVEDSIRLFHAHKAPGGLLEMFQSAELTEIVFAFGYDWVLEAISTNQACKRQIFVIIATNFVLVWVLFIIFSRLVFALQLPAMFVIRTVV